MTKLFSCCCFVRKGKKVKIGAGTIFGESQQKVKEHATAELNERYSSSDGYCNHGVTAFEIPMTIIEFVLSREDKHLYSMGCCSIKGTRLVVGGGLMIGDSQEIAWEKAMKQLINAHPPSGKWHGHIVEASEVTVKILRRALAESS